MTNHYYKSGNGPSKRRAGNTPPRKRGGGRSGGFKPSTLDPNLLVRKATEVEVINYQSKNLIKDLPVHESLIKCLLEKGFERPTEIQDRTLEALLQKRDLLGIAQTGTGKTGAFLIPIINQLLDKPRNSFALVVVPTRELALQVESEFKSMAKGLNMHSACFIGGTNINSDSKKLRGRPHVVIGTPGRLLDLTERGWLSLEPFNTLVLDEFDRMLDMGFVKDVKRIIAALKRRSQTMLFSATLDKKQQSLIDNILSSPVTVKVSSGETTGDHIDQDIIRIKEGDNKFKMLCDILSSEEVEKVLVFEETKHRVNKLSKMLHRNSFDNECIHGNKTQSARQKSLKAFKDGRVNILIATDVAARGIDISDVTHVINYQVPQTFDSYIHRIGRTGRAGRTGKALTFVD